jgi:hypothetical protein
METDDAHERRLTQVLLALALFLSYFESNKRSELTTHFKTIFDSGKFWKLDKIKSIQVNYFPRKIQTLLQILISIDSKFILSLSL